jgi:hypothetical protein
MTPSEKLSAAGSIASILGFFLTVYVWWRERIIGDDVEKLKKEEEAWHENNTDTPK